MSIDILALEFNLGFLFQLTFWVDDFFFLFSFQFTLVSVNFQSDYAHFMLVFIIKLVQFQCNFEHFYDYNVEEVRFRYRWDAFNVI